MEKKEAIQARSKFMLGKPTDTAEPQQTGNQTEEKTDTKQKTPDQKNVKKVDKKADSKTEKPEKVDKD